MKVTGEEANATNPEARYTDFVHTAPGTLAGRYMRSFWQPIRRSMDLSVKRALPIRIMGEDFTLYRGESGAPHLVAFRCAHRGTQLSAGWVEGECIRCFYHGWKYDASGQCVEQPAEDSSYASKIRIQSYQVQERLGLIFAYLGQDVPPPFPNYPAAEGQTAVEVRTYTRYCNYFQHLENLSDPVHVPFVHGTRWTYGRGNWKPENMPVVSVEEHEWGYIEHVAHPDRTVYSNQYHLPNLAFYPRVERHPHHPDNPVGSDTLRWKVPIDDESHMDFSVYLLPPNVATRQVDVMGRHPARTGADWDRVSLRAAELAAAVLAGRMTVEEVEAIAAEDPVFGGTGGNIGLVQDTVAQVGQGVIRVSDQHQEHLGRSDAGVIMRRKQWERALRALARDQEE